MSRKIKLLGLVLGLAIVFLPLILLLPSNDSNPPKPVYSAEEIYEKADYLVHLEVDVVVRNWFTGAEYRGTNILSGFVIKENGVILTAGHIVDRTGYEKIQKIMVYFKSGREAEEAVILGWDLRSGKDKALLKIKREGFKFYSETAKFGDSDTLKVGEEVIALGSPLGFRYFQTAGRVSKISDKHDEQWLSQRRFFNLIYKTVTANLGNHPYSNLTNLYFITGGDRFIMHSAVVNPGNSGGPLVNKHGEVVGMNVALLGESNDAFITPISVAIPINSVKDDLHCLEKGWSPPK